MTKQGRENGTQHIKANDVIKQRLLELKRHAEEYDCVEDMTCQEITRRCPCLKKHSS